MKLSNFFGSKREQGCLPKFDRVVLHISAVSAALVLSASAIFPGADIKGALAAPHQQMCETTNYYSLDWSQYDQLNAEDGTFPFVATAANIGGSPVDLTVTVPRDGQDDVHVNDPVATNFPGVVDAYSPVNAQVYRFWRQGDDAIEKLTFTFSETILLETFMFGGQRPPTEGSTYAYMELTFWDGPNGTGNKVESQLPTGAGVTTTINTGDPLASAINVLSDQGPQRSFLANGTYVGIGSAKNDRPWTVLQMGGAEVQSVTWEYYASSVDTNDLADARTNSVNAGNMSAYIGSLDFRRLAECIPTSLAQIDEPSWMSFDLFIPMFR